jgi:S-adenosylmethionine:tRNA ribosyltransferase-isomerase
MTNNIRTDDFDFRLPKELIAHSPHPDGRDASRLLYLRRENEQIEHHRFFELPSLLQAGDLLVFNNSKVFPSRLIGKKQTGGRVEVLLLRRLSAENVQEELWEVLVGGKVQKGTQILFSDDSNQSTHSSISIPLLTITLEERVSEQSWRACVAVNSEERSLSVREMIDRLGRMPIPPYMKDTTLTEQELREVYQTVYAKEEGSVAAPTAGLHFSSAVLAALEEKGIEMTSVTLHVGLGTFAPVKTEYIGEHNMHSEYVSVPEETAQMVNKAKSEGRRVIAVGTTAVRSLESSMEQGQLVAKNHWTTIFITPGYEFQCIDGLITNFHLPKSTLLMLVSAFAGKEFVMRAYSEAIKQHYRFYSFGDAMLIL